jgi:hypothetical protein
VSIANGKPIFHLKLYFMRKIFTLFAACLCCHVLSAQAPLNCNASNCTTNSTIDQCPPGSSNVVTNFQNKVQRAGNPCGNGLCVNAVWRYTNAATVSGNPVDAEVRVVAIVNAVLNNMDDDGATDQNNVSIASFFAPRIGPDVSLGAADRRGYVEFEIKFFQRFANTALNFITTQPLTGLNFVHYDIDGFSSGTNGWFREFGDVKTISATNPALFAASGTELVANATAPVGWKGFLGSVCERTGVSRCSEVAVSANYTGAQSTISFRMGYDYKAGTGAGQPTRQYGARFGCFDFPGGGPLPVTLSNLGVTYRADIATLNWTALYESQMKGYAIERSFDGTFYENIGFVGAKNQLGNPQLYQFSNTISAALSPVVYYRLRIIDLDGKIRYSNVVLVRKDKESGVPFSISPNPARDQVQLRIAAEKTGLAEILLIDATGRIMRHQRANLFSGTNIVALNGLGQLASGSYQVKIVCGEKMFTERLVIKP